MDAMDDMDTVGCAGGAVAMAKQVQQEKAAAVAGMHDKFAAAVAAAGANVDSEAKAEEVEGTKPEVAGGFVAKWPVVKLPVAVDVAGAVGYVPRHVEVSKLSVEQSRGLEKLFAGLDREGARLKSGARVTSRADVVRWFLEEADAEL